MMTENGRTGVPEFTPLGSVEADRASALRELLSAVADLPVQSNRVEKARQRVLELMPFLAHPHHAKRV